MLFIYSCMQTHTLVYAHLKGHYLVNSPHFAVGLAGEDECHPVFRLQSIINDIYHQCNVSGREILWTPTCRATGSHATGSLTGKQVVAHWGTGVVAPAWWNNKSAAAVWAQWVILSNSKQIENMKQTVYFKTFPPSFIKSLQCWQLHASWEMGEARDFCCL